MTDSGPVAPRDLLEQSEVELLVRALLEWGGPAHASDELARGMGFTGTDDLMDRGRAFRQALRSDDPIDGVDWARILLAAEIAFASDLMGSGTEWRTTTGMADDETVAALRSIQRQLGGVLLPYYSKTPA